jgi:hypothetical protein
MRLFVVDLQTQTLLNSSGIDLGTLGAGNVLQFVDEINGGISLRVQPVFRIVVHPSLGDFNLNLALATGVGILVQRIVGHHRLLGRTVPTLKLVGRVPLGHHARGHVNIKWNRRVNGHKLARGTYLVTLRAVTTNRTVTDYGPSFTERIR